MKKIILFIFFTFISCSSNEQLSNIHQNSILKHEVVKYNLTENSGEYIIHREKGFKKSSNEFVVKKVIYPSNNSKDKILERSVAISTVGILKNKVTIMRPKISRYDVWFDGKKYSNEIKLDTTKKVLSLSLKSPEKKWNGQSTYNIPNSSSVYCFFSQLIECTSITGFINKAKEKGYGKMNFYVIWNGYPFFHEQYLNLKNSIFSKAFIEIDKIEKNGNVKISLNIDNQIIFYVLNDKLKLIKQFWVQQGLSMLEIRN